ncbi:hypothetical protein DFS34DRAFT_642105 [Phlyctochytrium arcticum]|nr:hypothetical protein DFS34DRAFT_642105 [Phlyctochytrium arcticum]
MYNGIGLSTARGSGTNGYVQRNLSTLKPRTKFSDQRFDETKAPVIRKANQEILTHERKREIELKCFTLQQQLEAKGETEVAERVQNLREELLKKLEDQQLDSKRFKEHQVHQIAEAKEKADARIRAAFGIRDDFVPGAAFDKDLQVRTFQSHFNTW